MKSYWLWCTKSSTKRNRKYYIIWEKDRRRKILMYKSYHLVQVASMRLVYACTCKWCKARMPGAHLKSIMYEDWRITWRICWKSIWRCSYRRMNVEGVASDYLCWLYLMMKAMVLWRMMGKSLATSAASCIMISLWKSVATSAAICVMISPWKSVATSAAICIMISIWKSMATSAAICVMISPWKSMATSDAICVMIMMIYLWTNSRILWWTSISAESWKIMATVRMTKSIHHERKWLHCLALEWTLWEADYRRKNKPAIYLYIKKQDFWQNSVWM